MNIESLDAKKIDGIGLVMLRVNHCDRALSLLRNACWNAITEDALRVRVQGDPGAIITLAKRVWDVKLNVKSMRIGLHHGDWDTIGVNAELLK